MSFDTLLGNDRLKENLAESLAKNRISHFYLISGPRGSGKKTLARLLSAAVLCSGRRKPCGTCSHCRKALAGTHPDILTVADPDHKTVPVKLVRQYREDAFIRPNEAERKLYLFPQELGVEGQNALLKLLEEPPPYGIFLLLTDNPEKILPTVRSRCTELKLSALPEPVLMQALQQRFPGHAREDLAAAAARSGGFLGQAAELLEEGGAAAAQTEDLIQALTEKNRLLLAQTLGPLEKWKRDALSELLQSWLELVQQALTCRAGGQSVFPLARSLGQSRSAQDLHDMAMALKKALQYTQSNVSPAAVCGWLLWQLR